MPALKSLDPVPLRAKLPFYSGSFFLWNYTVLLDKKLDTSKSCGRVLYKENKKSQEKCHFYTDLHHISNSINNDL